MNGLIAAWYDRVGVWFANKAADRPPTSKAHDVFQQGASSFREQAATWREDPMLATVRLASFWFVVLSLYLLTTAYTLGETWRGIAAAILLSVALIAKGLVRGL